GGTRIFHLTRGGRIMLLELFLAFLKIGSVSFGGGYAVIPLIQYEIESRGWLTGNEFQETVALAGMAPGPIATNSATLVGFKTAGMAGAIVTTLGMLLPSLIAVILLALLFSRQSRSRWFRSTLYGLRPVVTGLIAYAAIHFGFLSGQEALLNWKTVGTV